MTIVYETVTQYFVKNFTHTPKLWESYYPFEEGNCWNCGGEFLVEFRNEFGYFSKIPCFFCSAGGVTLWSVFPVQFQPGWVTDPDYNNIFYLAGQSNLISF